MISTFAKLSDSLLRITNWFLCFPIFEWIVIIQIFESISGMAPHDVIDKINDGSIDIPEE